MFLRQKQHNKAAQFVNYFIPHNAIFHVASKTLYIQHQTYITQKYKT